MPGRSFRISPAAVASLRALTPPELRREVERDLAEALGAGGGAPGVPLLGPFEGLRSVSVARGRVRAVLRGREVLWIGHRLSAEEDVVAVARRLLRLLLGP